jgi:hypothetical protein
MTFSMAASALPTPVAITLRLVKHRNDLSGWRKHDRQPRQAILHCSGQAARLMKPRRLPMANTDRRPAVADRDLAIKNLKQRGNHRRINPPLLATFLSVPGEIAVQIKHNGVPYSLDTPFIDQEDEDVPPISKPNAGNLADRHWGINAS